MKEELKLLRDCVKNLDAVGFLKDNTSEKEVEKACVTYLKMLGYKIAKKPLLQKVNKLDELVDLFYNLMEFYHNDVCSLVSNRKKDKVLLANFIKQRQEELGTTFYEGLQDCANIIYSLFIFEDNLGLSLPVGIGVFSENSKWITDKVINILNNNKDVENEVQIERLILKKEAYAEENSGFDFLKLRRIYGKEEK